MYSTQQYSYVIYSITILCLDIWNSRQRKNNMKANITHSYSYIFMLYHQRKGHLFKIKVIDRRLKIIKHNQYLG